MAYKRQRRGYWEAEDPQARGIILVFVVVLGAVTLIGALFYSFSGVF